MGLIISFAIASVLALNSCSKTEPPPAKPADIKQTPSAAATPSAKPPAEPELRSACALVTAAEMTAILGSAVTVKGDDRLSQTKCTYSTPKEEYGPYAELQLSWESGEAGMAGVGMMGRIEPGMMRPGVISPYAGLGDQATSVGPALWIKRGEDLIEILVTNVDDTPAKVKQIYNMLDKRLPKSTDPNKPISDGTEPKPAKSATAQDLPPELSNLLGALGGMLNRQQQQSPPSPRSRAESASDSATAPKVERVVRAESSERDAKEQVRTPEDKKAAGAQNSEQETGGSEGVVRIPLR